MVRYLILFFILSCLQLRADDYKVVIPPSGIRPPQDLGSSTQERSRYSSSKTAGCHPGIVIIDGKFYFTPGATQEEVVFVMGKPNRKISYRWFYGDSTVDFSVSVKIPVVTGYRINKLPLRVYDRDPFLWP